MKETVTLNCRGRCSGCGEEVRGVSAMKIRIRFRKYGVMKFIGHLDDAASVKVMRRAH